MTDRQPRHRIRVARSEEREATITARTEALRPFLGRSAEDRDATLRRLLRAERRAARAGSGYDAVRHAALCRLMAEGETRPPAAIRGTHDEKGRHPG